MGGLTARLEGGRQVAEGTESEAKHAQEQVFFGETETNKLDLFTTVKQYIFVGDFFCTQQWLGDLNLVPLCIMYGGENHL